MYPEDIELPKVAKILKHVMDTIRITAPDDDLEGEFEETGTTLKDFRNLLKTIEGALPLSDIGVLRTDVSGTLQKKLI